jgi:stage III sporulation protein AA
MRNISEILEVLPVEIRDRLKNSEINFSYLQEIRMRVNRPLQILYDGQRYFFDLETGCSKSPVHPLVVRPEQLNEALDYMSGYSIYAFQDELKNGFLTIQGGHRVGIVGKVILEGGQIRGMKYISGMNIRIAHEKIGCANQLIPYLFEELQLLHTLIISPPGCGKTTLLRDLVRKLSNGGFNAGVVDERGELAACYMGIPQNDLGMQTDVIDACPKAEGIMMLIRSMAPNLIAVDEIGGKEDVEAIRYGIGCGCAFLATIHGKTLEDVRKRLFLKEMLKNQSFQRFIVLSSIGKISGIYNGRGEKICGFLEL